MNTRQSGSVRVTKFATQFLALSLLAGCGQGQPAPASPEDATAELVELSNEMDSEDIDRVRQLIESGADVNATDDDGWTPLDNATNGDLIEIAELLLENGAEVRGQLIWASRNDYVEFVKLFLKHDADVNAVDDEGKTALQYATEEGNTEIIALLKEHGAE